MTKENKNKRAKKLEKFQYIKNLQKDALDNKRWMETYLLTFAIIELNISLLIDHRITMTRYPKCEEYYKQIVEGEHYLSELINIFCSLYDDELFVELKTVNRDRNKLIHNFDIKPNFEDYIKEILCNALLVENELGKLWRKELKRGEKFRLHN
jgi:hypothetical protein